MIEIKIIKSNTAPQGNNNIRWIDTNTSPYIEYEWTLSGWKEINLSLKEDINKLKKDHLNR